MHELLQLSGPPGAAMLMEGMHFDSAGQNPQPSQQFPLGDPQGRCLYTWQYTDVNYNQVRVEGCGVVGGGGGGVDGLWLGGARASHSSLGELMVQNVCSHFHV